LFIHNFLRLIDTKFGVLRVLRDEEFSPVKNAEGAGKDSPEVARMMTHHLHAEWLRNSGVEFDGLVEISPLDSYEGENLKRKKAATKK
jgi:UDP-N-acetylglucosamine/UDP-N-acetylgalactosamine diphosphorylase